MTKTPQPEQQAALEQRLQALMQHEASRLAAEWSAPRQRPPTLGELEAGVLAALRRLGPQLLEGLVSTEAQDASLSPPVRMRHADEGHRAPPQTPADAAGRDHD